MRGEPSRRSPVPRDLRTAGPASVVTTYWDSQAFSWYGPDPKKAKPKDEMFIHISKTQIRISQTATVLTGIQHGDRVMIGINSTFIALKKDDGGIEAKVRVGKSQAVTLSASKIIKKLAADGMSIPCRLACVLDAKSNLLVARRVSGGEKHGQ